MRTCRVRRTWQLEVKFHEANGLLHRSDSSLQPPRSFPSQWCLYITETLQVGLRQPSEARSMSGRGRSLWQEAGRGRVLSCRCRKDSWGWDGMEAWRQNHLSPDFLIHSLQKTKIKKSMIFFSKKHSCWWLFDLHSWGSVSQVKLFLFEPVTNKQESKPFCWIRIALRTRWLPPSGSLPQSCPVLLLTSCKLAASFPMAPGSWADCSECLKEGSCGMPPEPRLSHEGLNCPGGFFSSDITVNGV